jgi:hypothetical protein
MTPRQLVPGGTRVSEALGQRVRQRMIRRFAASTKGDTSYSRHDKLGDSRLRQHKRIG